MSLSRFVVNLPSLSLLSYGRLAAFVLILAGCAGQPPVSAPVGQAACPACPVCPLCPTEPVRPPPPPVVKPIQPATWSDLPDWPGEDLPATWPALLESCRKLEKQALWQSVCAEAKRMSPQEVADTVLLRQFFENRFQPWQLVNPESGNREGLITGYYEPLLKGDRNKTATARFPLYAPPDDLLTLEFGDLFPELKNLRLRGRVEGKKVLPYWNRAQLKDRQAQMRDKVLLWANDPIEAFFLEIQGSGRVQLPDGSLVRLGYADQNGQPYHSIGRWLIEQGELRADQAGMEGIKAWARAHPERLEELLNVNPSYVFFRILPQSSGGPIGAMGLPLTPGRSIAVDPRVITLGAPVFLATSWPNDSRPLTRLMVAQDTGGAIKGAVRADFFWGFGADAGSLAGRMRQSGRLWLLMPNGYAPK